MPVSQVTNEFMRALPANLRPNPWSIDEYVMQALANGWTITALVEAAYVNDRNPNPAFVVTNVRNLSQHPPTQTKRPTGWQYGHVPCDRHPGCEICRCMPNELLHTAPTPMPDSFKATVTPLVRTFGAMPDA